MDGLDAYVAAEQASWQEALHSDTELGGAHLEQTQKNVNAFAQSNLATNEFLSMIKERGLSQHPEMVRLMSVVGNALSEDPMSIDGDGAVELSGNDRYRKMFGNSTPN